MTPNSSCFSTWVRSIAGNTRGDQPSRGHTRGRQAKSGGHSWETTREATESGAHSWGATRPEITLPLGASREILGETSQVGSTLVGDQPNRGDTRGRQLGRQLNREHTRGEQLGPRLHYLREPRGKYSGRPAKSGAHSWKTSQVGGTLVGGQLGNSFFSSRFGDGPGRGRASVLARKTIENPLSYSMLGELRLNIPPDSGRNRPES